ncbi:MAG: hypothetical protein H7301_06540 [Cryobacterium sp.]|nr:hypothetical protein [Oligoflexia bacterium]
MISALILSFVALFTFLALKPDPHAVPERFEAHEFAVFRSTFESLRAENAHARVAHLHTLSDVTEKSHLTPGMAEALAEFCEQVMTAVEEAPEVRAEAQAAYAVLESGLRGVRNNAARSPASR